MADLLIRINGDVKGYTTALEQSLKKTEDLSGALEKIAKTSGLIFAGLTAEIGFATHAFAESEAAALKQNQVLQNQGIYTKELEESYNRFAKAVQDKTGIDDDALISAQATIQGLIGQTQVTQEVTQAIADLATKTGSLDSAAEILGRGIEGNTRGLKQFHIEVDDGLSKQERMRVILEQVNQKFGGQAAAANEGLGSIKGLTTAFGNFQEQIGKQFAPIITTLIQSLTTVFQFFGDEKNEELIRLGAGFLAAGVAVAGVTAAMATGGIAFLKLKAAMEAAKVSTDIMTLSFRGLTAATGIGLIVLLAAEIYLHWSNLQAFFGNFTQNVGKLFSGLGSIISGALKLNTESIKAGLAEIQSAFAVQEKLVKNQDEQKKALAEKAANEEEARERRKLETFAANQRLILLQIEGGTKQQIDLQQKAADLLAKIEDEKNKKIRTQLQAHLEEVRALQQQADADAVVQKQIVTDEVLARDREYQSLSNEEKRQFLIANQDALASQVKTEAQTRQDAALLQAQVQADAHNLLLADTLKYGKLYAETNRIIHSAVYTGTKQAAGELVALQQSQNSTLRTVGQAAALYQIGLKTYESAMNIFAGFSTIPIIGPVLGVAGAAAAFAFGGEQAAHVLGLADGGLATGGIPGVDSIPALLQNKELVSPSQNFEEVIGSVRAAREAQNIRERGGIGGNVGSGGAWEVMLTMKDNLADFIEARIVERQRLGISQLGVA